MGEATLKEKEAGRKKEAEKETGKEKRARKKAEKAERKRVVNDKFLDMYKVAFKTVFGKGIKAFLVMILVSVVLSMISLDYAFGYSVFDQGDSLLGITGRATPDNEAILRDYLSGTKLGQFLDSLDSSPEDVEGDVQDTIDEELSKIEDPDERSEVESYIEDANGETVEEPEEDIKLSDMIIKVIAEKAGIVVQILSTNKEYVERNKGEIFALTVIAMVIIMILSFLIKKVSSVGQGRMLLENRYQRVPRLRRFFAPYGRGQFFHLVWVYIQFVFILFLWSLTVIGYFYKGYQYRMVPYLLAENPTLSWKQVKKISSQMTKGYKFKMFLFEMTTIPLWIFEMLIPVIGPLLGLSVIMQLDAEWYVRLRRRTDIDRSAFLEPIFDGDAYVVTHTEKKEYKALIKNAETEDEKKALKKELKAHLKEEGKENPDYVMPDILIDISNFEEADKYKVTDFIVMFFSFSLVGWLWEVALHIIQDHAFVNRGMMYGPWIPIYGFGGVFIIFFLNRFKNNKVKLVILTMILCGILEYLTSFVLDFAMNASYWDYKDLSFNLNGRICLAGLAAFAAGGFAGIYLIGPAIKGRLEKFGKKRTVILCMILVAAFLIDFICCRIFGSNSGAGVGGTI